MGNSINTYEMSNMQPGLGSKKRQLRWGRRLQGTFVAMGLALVSCGRLETRGGLMLMISHDGTLTEMDELRLAVESADGFTLLSRTYVVPDELGIPATLGIISNGKADATVTINVSGWVNGEPKDLRTAIVAQVPVRETVALPIVLAEKCQELVEEEEGEAVSKCGEEGTCNPETAECQSAEVDASELPEYKKGDEQDIGDPDNSSDGSSGGSGSGGTASGGNGSGGVSQGDPCTQEGKHECGMLPGPERFFVPQGDLSRLLPARLHNCAPPRMAIA